MILSDQTIRERGLIEPFFERTKHNGMSFGIGPASYDIRSNVSVTIAPKGFARISVIEYVKLPADVAAVVRDKSTHMREGVLVANGHFDPGFCGHPTLTIVNHSDFHYQIAVGDPIAQLVFEPLDRPAAMPYAGKYQNQGGEPVSARYDYDIVNDRNVALPFNGSV